MTVKEFIKGCEHDGSYIPVNEVIRLMKDYAKLKCEEQRLICFISADILVRFSDDTESFLTKCNENYICKDYNDGVGYTEYQSIDKDSILNAPEPKME